MAPTLQDLLNGDTPAVLWLHLTDVPLVEPYSLDNLTEPTWAGYKPCVLVIEKQSDANSGWAWLQGHGSFTYVSPSPAPTLQGLFVTADYQRKTYLLYVIDLADSGFQDLHRGKTTFTVYLDSYVIPAS